MKRPALQNKQVVVLRMAFRARKFLRTFEKRSPGSHCPWLVTLWSWKGLEKSWNFKAQSVLTLPAIKIIRVISLTQEDYEADVSGISPSSERRTEWITCLFLADVKGGLVLNAGGIIVLARQAPKVRVAIVVVAAAAAHREAIQVPKKNKKNTEKREKGIRWKKTKRRYRSMLYITYFGKKNVEVCFFLATRLWIKAI